MPLGESLRHATCVALTCALAAGLAVPAAAAGLADSVWPMFQHDAQHSGRTHVKGPRPAAGQEPTFAWYSKTRSRMRGAAAVGPNGNIYVGNGKNPLSAFEPTNGTTIWDSSNHSGGHADRSQPAVSASGVVYIGARDNDLWAVEASDGTVNWRYHVQHDGDVTTPPTIGQDGVIYMGSEALGAGWLFAMNPDGTPKWDVRPLRGSLKNASPALIRCEHIPDEDLGQYAHCTDVSGNRLQDRDAIVLISLKTDAVAYNSETGNELWRKTIAKKGYGSRHPNYAPVVSNDGSTAYFNSKNGLWALDPQTGDEVWDSPFVPKDKQMLQSAAAVGADGTLYFGASKKKSATFWALKPNGRVKWQHDHQVRGKYSNNQAAIDSEGVVYVPFGKYLFAFDGQGDGSNGSNLLWKLRLPARVQSGVIIGAEGVLYVGSGKNLWKVIGN